MPRPPSTASRFITRRDGKFHTKIQYDAKRQLFAHRDVLRKSGRPKANLSTSLSDVLESYKGEHLPHLWGNGDESGKMVDFTGRWMIPGHREWVERERSLFEGEEPSTGDVLSRAILLRLPSDGPLVFAHKTNSSRSGQREGESDGGP